MSAETARAAYDPVFDSQRHFRVLLNSTARPGTIGLLDGSDERAPEGLNRATVAIARALFSGDVSFYLEFSDGAPAQWLRAETQALTAPASQADFLLVNGEDAHACLETLAQARGGTLSFPDLGATVVVQVAALSPAPLPSGLRLELSGPGIESKATVFVSGMAASFFARLAERNREFPIGLDVLLTCDSLSAGSGVLALPRTTAIVFESV